MLLCCGGLIYFCMHMVKSAVKGGDDVDPKIIDDEERLIEMWESSPINHEYKNKDYINKMLEFKNFGGSVLKPIVVYDKTT